MTTKAELMAAGVSASIANRIGQDNPPGLGLTATGNSQATALPLPGSFAIFGTVAASAGAVLPMAIAKPIHFIANGGASALTVYPALGEQINGLAANASISIPAGKAGQFYASVNQWIANLSA